MSSDGQQIIGGTRQITGGSGMSMVKKVIREALEDLGEEIPAGLQS